MSGILPKGKHKPKTAMSDYSWLIYGPPKIGKTTFANTWPNALFVATEPGTAAMEAADIEVATWTDFMGVMHALQTERHDYRTIVIDTVDNLWEFLVDDICKSNGWDDLGDAGYGKGYKLARRKLTNVIAQLRSLPQAVLFISHERRDKEVNSKGQTSGKEMITSALPGSARKVLHGAVDFILRAEMDDDGVRQLRCAPHRDKKLEIECGARGEVSTPLPALMPLAFSDLRTNFQAAFKPAEPNQPAA